MIRWPGLPLIFLASWSYAAEPDTVRSPADRGSRPVYIAAPAESETARQVKELQSLVQTLETRLAKMEALLQNQAALNLLREVEAMRAEMSRMHGQSEMQTHQMESLGKRQTDLYTDLDKRLEDLNKQVRAAAATQAAAAAVAAAPAPAAAAAAAPAPEIAAAPASSPVPALVTSTQLSFPPASAPGTGFAAAEKPSAAASAQADDPLADSKAYEAALNHFKAGNYAAAIAGFKNFLKAYPGSRLASNAQYWVGYSYYALKDYKTALSHQFKLVAAYPHSAKVPDALLNMASCQAELEDADAAKKTLEEIVSKHPGTNAARIAARRLAALK
jgi:tol-pal system protein YbgF